MNRLRLALVGNPNCGKSSLFNKLTGMHQKTGNFPGVTVEKITGHFHLHEIKIEITDLPGTYSLHPITEDEHVVLRSLLNDDPEQRPEAILYIADSTQLERHLLMYSQVRDLGIPVFLAFSMSDVARDKEVSFHLDEMEKTLGQRPVLYNVRDHLSVKKLKEELYRFLKNPKVSPHIYTLRDVETKAIQGVNIATSDYAKLLMVHHGPSITKQPEVLSAIEKVRTSSAYLPIEWQVEETLQRYQYIEHSLHDVYTKDKGYLGSDSHRADRWLTHSGWGPLIFLFIMFLIFQAIFSLAEWPMDAIDWLFASLAGQASLHLPESAWTRLLTEGLIPGIAGVLIFIPQIALLFFLVGLLEESGYMARAVFLFDKFFQRFGLNGRSLVALVSASACAIPAIMSARSIKNEKERLITIMVSPLMSCSARTPVYVVLIAFIVSNKKILGWINPQGLVFIGFYLLGLVAALAFALILKKIFRSRQPSFLMLELPEYKWPNWKTVLMHTWHKVRGFVMEAGKIILLISVGLWFLASYGPGDRDDWVQREAARVEGSDQWTQDEREAFTQQKKLESSYAGILGKSIEPAIAPLGFDWKIGIALITSFAAREVFVSTMATIYSVGDAEDYQGIQAQMKKEVRVSSNQPMYNRATALSLVIFYIFAMQCMSTLAVVRRETGTWKWPLIQFFIMSALAYFSSLFVYQMFS